MARPVEGFRRDAPVLCGCHLFRAGRVCCRAEDVFDLMSACLGMEVGSGGGMARSSCRVGRGG